jgi:hypothetical protein
MIEVGCMRVVDYEDANKTMIEVGWIFVVGYEDVKKANILFATVHACSL